MHKLFKVFMSLALAFIMLFSMATQGAQGAPEASYSTGRATYYSPGLMAHVASIRARQGYNVSLRGLTGYATYPYCSSIGRIIYVQVLNPHTGRWSAWEGKRVVDCSQNRDLARHLAQGLVEFSYSDAVRYGYQSEGRTQVRFRLGGR